MKTITYALVSSLCFLFLSCNINIDYLDKIEGEGEVITEQILLDSFTHVELKKGWKIILEPASSNYMVVEANENLFEVFEYENKNGKLILRASKQISNADAKQITLYFTEKLESLKVSSGTEVTSPERLNFENLDLDLSSGGEVTLDLELNTLNIETSSGSAAHLVLNLDDLFVDSSSGAYADLDVNAISVNVESSSGSEVNLKGTTSELDVQSSSGSNVDAERLMSDNVASKASSGAYVTVYSVVNLKAETSSGGNIKYLRQPTGDIELNKSKSGGSIEIK